MNPEEFDLESVRERITESRNGGLWLGLTSDEARCLVDAFDRERARTEMMAMQRGAVLDAVGIDESSVNEEPEVSRG